MNRAGLVVLVAGLALAAGCAADGEELEPTNRDGGEGTAEAGDEADLTVAWKGVNAPEQLHGIQHRVIAVLASPADAEDDSARVVWAGDRYHSYLDPSDNATVVANGSLPAGDYDEVLIRWAGGGRSKAGISVGEDAEREAPEVPDLPEDHLTRPLTNDLGLPVDVVVEANLTLVDGPNRIEISQDLRADEETDGVAITNVTQDRGDGPSAVDHRVRLERAGALEAPTSPEADFELTVGDDSLGVAGGPNGSFANGRSSPVLANQTLRIDPSPSRAATPDGALVTAVVRVPADSRWLLPAEPDAERRIGLEQPGVHEVTLTVADDAGGIDRKTVRVVLDRVEWSSYALRDDLEDPEGWTTDAAEERPGSWTRWTHLSDSYLLEYSEDVTGFGLRWSNSYGPEADATLTSPTVEIPGDWRSAGYAFSLVGSSQPPDRLTVEAIVDGESREIATFTEAGGARAEVLEDREALDDALGSEVAFRFTFTSDELDERGRGWWIDHLAIGGVDLETRNPELLAQAPP